MFEKGNDFLLDSSRRTEIIAYVASMVKKGGITQFKIVYLNSFNIMEQKGVGFGKESGSPVPGGNHKVNNTPKSQTYQSKKSVLPDSQVMGLDFVAVDKKSKISIFQDTMRNAKISGYLKIRKTVKKLFGSKHVFTEFFFILTNLGLVFFKKLGVSLPVFFLIVRMCSLRVSCRSLVRS